MLSGRLIPNDEAGSIGAEGVTQGIAEPITGWPSDPSIPVISVRDPIISDEAVVLEVGLAPEALSRLVDAAGGDRDVLIRVVADPTLGTDPPSANA